MSLPGLMAIIAPPAGGLSDAMLTGADGALHLTNGQILSLAPGTFKSYSSITIDSGGTLTTTGPGWLKIGCVGACVINGNVDLRVDSGVGSNPDTGVTYSDTAPDGMALSYTLGLQATGGTGGSCSASGNEAGGGGDPGSTGGGGGGATAGSGGQDSINGNGGQGGEGNFEVGAGGGGVGQNGGSGLDHTDNSAQQQASSGGGGGGRGINGTGLYLKTQGNATGSGHIIVGGLDGGAGGKGGDMNNQWPDDEDGGQFGSSSIAGSGGGGGGGGAGGKFVGRHHGTFTISVVLTGGAGGVGGGGSFATAVDGTITPGNAFPGDGGGAGSPGDDAISNVASY